MHAFLCATMNLRGIVGKQQFSQNFLNMRTISFVVALLASVSSAMACDVCGCSIGGNYFGILPQFHKHFVGMRWSAQSYRAAHSLSAARAGAFDSDEYFQTYDLIGRFYPWRRLQMLALLPYHNFERVDNGALTHNQGLGDLSLMGNYILLDSGDSLRHKWRHTLTIGGGVKLPTGKYGTTDSEGEPLHENLQPGSGTVDFMVSATYTLRKGLWGLSTDVLGRLNTANRNDYTFGNRVSGSAKVFYVKNFSKMTLLPNVGLFADVAEASIDNGYQAEGTGGFIALSTFGLDIYFGKISLGYTFQLPVVQDLGGGKIQNQNRWMATLNYNF